MIKLHHQTLQDFYRWHQREESEHDINPVAVYRREEFSCSRSLESGRYKFYKVSLCVQGSGRLGYADCGVDITRSALAFSDPHIPYSWEPYSAEQTGYFCLFTEDFLSRRKRHGVLPSSPFFQLDGDPVRFPDEEQTRLISYFFERMLLEQNSNYPGKYAVIHNYLDLIIHEALKMQPSHLLFRNTAAFRLCSQFMILLDQHFSEQGDWRKPADFAGQLYVHVNHLNRSVREVTGKTTTTLIAERAVLEAKHLLLQPSHTIAEIAYRLGFNHPGNFNIFFKKHTGLTPTEFRRQTVCSS
ncbi:helix-turn-helix domain-containing protein [Sedimenticola sp.]|uniref:helix-turn-helix domain-containing protein n=1 Tax=Sedimenticola sp. TaxID=1940285 RepID=UPI003D0CEA34